jgi:hypothetical protein
MLEELDNVELDGALFDLTVEEKGYRLALYAAADTGAGCSGCCTASSSLCCCCFSFSW